MPLSPAQLVQAELASFYQNLTPEAVPTDAPQAATPGTQSRPADEAPPAKWPRDNSNGQGNKPGKGTSGHSWQGGQDWWSEGQQVKQLKAEVACLRENMQLLARMALRHEDELVQMRFEKEFLISMDVGEHGILNTMYAASLAWKDKRSQQAATMTTSLRRHMFQAMIQEWSNRLQKLKASLEAQAGAVKSLMAKQGPSNELHCIYLKWNAQNSSL